MEFVSNIKHPLTWLQVRCTVYESLDDNHLEISTMKFEIPYCHESRFERSYHCGNVIVSKLWNWVRIFVPYNDMPPESLKESEFQEGIGTFSL